MKRTRGLFAVICLLWCAVAAADSAKDYDARGAAAFKAARWDDAVAAWTQAYAMGKKPLVLFNLGLAQLKRVDRAAALAAFEGYLGADPDGPGAEEARGYLVTLRRELAAEPETQAKVRAQAGEAALAGGDWAKAISELGAAYQLWPDAEYLFEIAQAQRGAGDAEKALEGYARYLAVAPTGRYADEARQRQTALKAELSVDQQQAAEAAEAAGTLGAAVALAAQAATGAEAAAKIAEQVLAAVESGQTKRTPEVEDAAALADTRATQARQAADVARAAAGRATGEAATAQASTAAESATRAQASAARAQAAAQRARQVAAGAEQRASRASSGRSLRIAGWLTMGVGVAAIGFGVFEGLAAKQASDDLSGAHTWSAHLATTQSDGRAAEKRMVILYVAGGVTLAGGVVLYLLGRSKGSGERSYAVAPAAGPHFAGLTVAGGF